MALVIVTRLEICENVLPRRTQTYLEQRDSCPRRLFQSVIDSRSKHSEVSSRLIMPLCCHHGLDCPAPSSSRRSDSRAGHTNWQRKADLTEHTVKQPSSYVTSEHHPPG